MATDTDKATEELNKALSLLSTHTLSEIIKACEDDRTLEAENEDLVNSCMKVFAKLRNENFAIRILLPEHRAAAAAALNMSLDELMQHLKSPEPLAPLLAKLPASVIKLFRSVLGFDEEATPGPLSQTLDEIALTGAETLLEKLPPTVLSRMCSDLKIKYVAQHAIDNLMEPKQKFDQSPEKDDTSEDRKRKKGKNKENIEERPAKRRKHLTEEKEEDEEEEEEDKKKDKKRKKGKSSKAETSSDESESKQSDTDEDEYAQASKRRNSKVQPQLVGYRKENGEWIAPSIDTIKKGVYTKADLYSNFNRADLRKFLVAHGLPKIEKKNAMIKAILDYLDGKAPSEAKQPRKSKSKPKNETEETSDAQKPEGKQPSEKAAK